MGVPQFFHWLVSRYESEILRQVYPGGKPPEYLFLDFNCGIHPASKQEGLETLADMYQAVCVYLETIVKQVKPTKCVYIAVDGVAPMAKMRQQRFRRFKSVQDQREKDKIDRRFNKWKEQKFDFNMISPGTEFMNDLTVKLTEFIKGKWPHLKVILDDASNPCEGEHKIMDYLRKQVPQDARVAIYGLDSDLIFLGLLQYRPYMCLFREQLYFGKEPSEEDKNDPEKKFTYLDLGVMRKIVVQFMNPALSRAELEGWEILQPKDARFHKKDMEAIKELYDEVNEADGTPPSGSDNLDLLEQASEAHQTAEVESSVQTRLIWDYVALSFILGNDFLPYLPSLKIKEGGLNRVIECYKEVQSERSGSFLVNAKADHFDIRFLRSLLQKLSDYEEVDLKEHQDASELRQSRFKSSYRFRNADKYEKALMDFEYVENKAPDVLKMGSPGWKSRYYDYYLGDCTQELIQGMVENYLEGMLWIQRYYHGECPSWSWYYHYRAAPSVSTLLNYLEDNGRNSFDHVKLVAGEPVTTEEQLLTIFPPQSRKLLAEPYQKLMKDQDSPLSTMYPIDFDIEYVGHRYRWECYPRLPDFNPDMVKQVVDTLQNPIDPNKVYAIPSN